MAVGGGSIANRAVVAPSYTIGGSTYSDVGAALARDAEQHRYRRLAKHRRQFQRSGGVCGAIR
ncbi:hypothetical protein BN2475_550016 [Paraburkholderia ribeironis]|uniref:Uncharacterized protein n=1 Tax=Paraburkholderia ribeironis TaxID=1247936 RepID=A0A1N7SDD5_9BURK|nr:hypothetical protein BN2475_550016 [Paraburkholderia ribeironis]